MDVNWLALTGIIASVLLMGALGFVLGARYGAKAVVIGASQALMVLWERSDEEDRKVIERIMAVLAGRETT